MGFKKRLKDNFISCSLQRCSTLNYLAHLFLTRENEAWTLGNFMTDFIRKSETKKYAEPIQQGIKLHYFIDTYTDIHPAVRRGTKLLRPYFRKYSPVVIDIYFDYFLSKNFTLFSKEESLAVFSQRMYDLLELNIDELPRSMQTIVPKMIKGDWLQSYSTIDGIDYTLLRLKSRVAFTVPLEEGAEVLVQNEEKLNEIFLDFFPDIISALEKEKNKFYT